MNGLNMPDRAVGPPAEGAPATSSNSATTSRLAVVGLALAAIGVRLAAMRGDLVLDEIWTLLIIMTRLDSIWKIFFFNHDNNHILNTLVVYGLGPSVPPLAYRVPATLASCLALWFGYRVGRRNGAVAGFLVLFLLGLSHIFILYGTEARGYAYLTCATLAAWWALDAFLDQPQEWNVALFALCVILGFLSQLPFAFAYAGFGVYSILRLARHPRGWRLAVVLHFVPVLTCVAIYFTFVRDMIAGGGEKFPVGRVLVAALSLPAGGPETGTAAVFAASVAAIVFVIALANEFSIDRLRGALYATAVALAPAGVILISRYQFVYPRHFLVPAIFCYIAVANLLARWIAAGGAGRAIAVGLLAAFGCCNLVPVMRLLAQGRAQYSAAVRWMAEQTTGPEVVVASDFDFRNATVAAFYATQNADVYEGRGKQFVYVRKEDFGRRGAEWYLQHNFAGDPAPAATWSDPSGKVYDLMREFPAGSISGWNWWLYRRR
jgi:hypothetical protein